MKLKTLTTMLNNEKLNRRLKKIFTYLRDNWGITLYRIAVESKIPHSSLKYMIDGKFEWKLNHLLSIVDFLNRNNVKISLEELLNFDDKTTLSQIMNTDKADFREVIYGDKEGYKTFVKSGESIIPKAVRPRGIMIESEELTQEITERIKESPLFKSHRISVGIKISDKNFDFHQDLNFLNGKKLKD